MNTTQSKVQVPQKQQHLQFLDGLRGLAALYVLFYHAYLRANGGLPRPLTWLIAPFSYGRIAVDIFIVLSGYCLMLPVARSSDGRLRGGVGNYLKRRARRILPPYYIAYIISLGLVLASEVPRYLLHRPNELREAIAPGNILTHLLMVFNLSDAYRFTINGAFWSVATEWQIYFVFPLALLPVWQRWGTMATVVAGLLLGMGLHYLLPMANFGGGSLYYIALFALGMAGAAVSFPQPTVKATTDRWPWGLFALILAIPFVVLTACVKPINPLSPALLLHYTPWSDYYAGLITVCLLVGCAHRKQQGDDKRSPVLRLLESPFAVGLGTFSYSIYLTHIAVLDKLNQVVLHFHVSPIIAFVCNWIIGTAIALAIAYVYYLAVERKFVNTRAAT